MGPILRRTLVILSASVVAVLGVLGVGVAWQDRAEDVCGERASPRKAVDDSVTWDWRDLAYVCDDSIGGKEQKRVGIVDAFHGEGRRHGR
jgi:hypothetical protein